MKTAPTPSMPCGGRRVTVANACDTHGTRPCWTEVGARERAKVRICGTLSATDRDADCDHRLRRSCVSERHALPVPLLSRGEGHVSELRNVDVEWRIRRPDRGSAVRVRCREQKNNLPPQARVRRRIRSTEKQAPKRGAILMGDNPIVITPVCRDDAQLVNETRISEASRIRSLGLRNPLWCPIDGTSL